MTNLHETSNPERRAEIDTLGWLLSALVVVVTASAWMVAYNANNVQVSNNNVPVSNPRLAGPPVSNSFGNLAILTAISRVSSRSTLSE
jgi:hypothetical protein